MFVTVGGTIQIAMGRIKVARGTTQVGVDLAARVVSPAITAACNAG